MARKLFRKFVSGSGYRYWLMLQTLTHKISIFFVLGGFKTTSVNILIIVVSCCWLFVFIQSTVKNWPGSHPKELFSDKHSVCDVQIGSVQRKTVATITSQTRWKCTKYEAKRDKQCVDHHFFVFHISNEQFTELKAEFTLDSTVRYEVYTHG